MPGTSGRWQAVAQMPHFQVQQMSSLISTEHLSLAKGNVVFTADRATAILN